MPSQVAWFTFRSQLHARNDTKIPRLVSRCGISPHDAEGISLTLADDSDMPAGACSRCLVAVGLDSTIDESVVEAIDRGYVPTDGRVNL